MSKRDQAIIFGDDGTLEILDVVEADAEGVETKRSLYPTSEASVYLNRTRGAMTYVYNADLPTKLEAEKLKICVVARFSSVHLISKQMINWTL
ncbi:hypothetical protein P7H20_26620 [Paenibacillus larvae]|nr:hypothetical protein [Paenibacillus larvae]MDT2277702.1 hypothetical protein [Paenibacillus larvae]